MDSYSVRQKLLLLVRIYNQYIIEYCAPATNEGTQFVGLEA